MASNDTDKDVHLKVVVNGKGVPVTQIDLLGTFSRIAGNAQEQNYFAPLLVPGRRLYRCL
jgi:hypothetical protein